MSRCGSENSEPLLGEGGKVEIEWACNVQAGQASDFTIILHDREYCWFCMQYVDVSLMYKGAYQC